MYNIQSIKLQIESHNNHALFIKYVSKIINNKQIFNLAISPQKSKHHLDWLMVLDKTNNWYFCNTVECKYVI